MDTNEKKVPAKVLRDFNDAGTERRFTANTEVELTEGELANYQAGGLVEPIAPPVSVVAAPESDADETKKTGRRG